MKLSKTKAYKTVVRKICPYCNKAHRTKEDLEKCPMLKDFKIVENKT